MRRVSAASLPYAIMVMTIVVTMVGIVVFMVYLYRDYFLIIERHHLVDLNLRSAERLLLAQETIGETSDSVSFSLFNSGNDTVVLIREQWGGLSLLKVVATIGEMSSRSAFIAGNYYTTDSLSALRLSADGTALSLVGNTILVGKVVVPNANVKPGFANGTLFLGDTLVRGTIKPATGDNPSIDSALDISCSFINFSRMFNDYTIKDVLYGELSRFDTLERSFYDPPLYFYSRDELIINEIYIKGHILLFSESNIRICASSHIEDAVVVSPVIVIDSGFSGNVQCLASDSIIINKGACLKFPSFVACGLGKSVYNVDIQPFVRVDGALEGTMICKTPEQKNKKIAVSIGKSGIVIGLVHTTGFTCMEGKILGSCISRGFLYQDPITLYENFLIGGEINSRDIPLGYVSINSVRNKKLPFRVIKWLN